MANAGAVTIDQVKKALRDLGGEATWPDILDQLTGNRNGDFSHYRDQYTYETTAYQVIQRHCPGYEKYKGPTHFERVGDRFRLSEAASGTTITLRSDEANPSEATGAGDYTPIGSDRRPLVERQIRERRGQQQFRDALRERYRDSCLVTGSEILALLEAAHICPHRGEEDNHLDNGLLLRADIHTLFDLDLLGIEPDSLQVELHPDVATEYGHLRGVRLGCQGAQRPSREALQYRYIKFCQRCHSPA